jgi:hypothetical protein
LTDEEKLSLAQSVIVADREKVDVHGLVYYCYHSYIEDMEREENERTKKMIAENIARKKKKMEEVRRVQEQAAAKTPTANGNQKGKVRH